MQLNNAGLTIDILASLDLDALFIEDVVNVTAPIKWVSTSCL